MGGATCWSSKWVYKTVNPDPCTNIQYYDNNIGPKLKKAELCNFRGVKFIQKFDEIRGW